MKLVRNASVYFNGVAVKEEICKAMQIINDLHMVHTGQDAEFTSIVDGKHKRASQHYSGLACDVRIWYVDPAEFSKQISEVLGNKYDVVLEDDHIHVEFQPKLGESSD